MFYADWITDGIFWWGQQLWYFMRLLPPYDWVASPDYELKLALYITPLIIIYLLPWLLYFRSRRKVSRLKTKKRTFSRNIFHCPHCSYIPEHPPAHGTWYCPKCGKFSKQS
ncbi:MAG: hypothetical protein ACXAC6_11610 [Candidatus Hodarchaeales archaeon]|jgi:hypothetical protein